MNKSQIFFERIPSIILVFLPLSLITGPFLSDLSITIIAIIFLTQCVINKNFNYFNNIYFKYFIAFYLICLISSILSDFKLISSIKSFFYIRFGVFGLAVYYLLSKNKSIIRYIFLSLLVCFLTLIIDGFIQYIFGKNIIGLPKQGIRLSSFFGEELILGSYLSRLLPILIGVFFMTNYSKKNINIFLFSIFLIFTIILIYLTGERAAFFLTILSITYLIVMINKYSKNIAITFFVSFIFITIINLNSPSIQERMISYTKDQLGLSDTSVNSSYVYKGHFLIARDLFKENPILGVGPKNYTQHCNNNQKFQVPPYVCTSHPHNTYVQLLAETGLLGTFMVFFLFIFISYLSAKHIFLKLFKNKNLFSFQEICIISSILITLWPLITSGSFFNNYLNVIYFYPIGIFLWLRRI